MFCFELIIFTNLYFLLQYKRVVHAFPRHTDLLRKQSRKEVETMTVSLLETIIKALVILELFARIVLALLTK